MEELLAGLSEAVDAVAAARPRTTDEHRAVAIAAELLARRLRGVASRSLAAVAEVDEDPQRWWRDAVAISGEAAGRAHRRAVGLTRLPGAEEAVVDGRLSLEQAGALVPLAEVLGPEDLDDVVEQAAGRTVENLQQWVRHRVALEREELLELEAARAADKRYLSTRLLPDGTVRGSFCLPAAEAESLFTVVEALARAEGAHDPRSAGQRRADALVSVFDAAAGWMDLPEAGGQRAQLSYVVAADWAAGARSEDGAVGAWTGPQTRDRIEALCCDARISRVLLDRTAQVVQLESVSDQITLAQRRAVSARDVTCVARGCSRPPAFCDVHHLVSRRDGGPTAVGNLVLLCRRHHVQWHAGRLVLAQLRVPWLRTPEDPPLVA